MNSTVAKLMTYAAGGTDITDKTPRAKFSTRATKTTDETDKTPLTGRKLPKSGSCVSFVSDFPDASAKNTLDPEAIVERAAIMEFDGNLSRASAEAMAAAEVDARRTQGTTADAEAWRGYIEAWRPSAPGDLPAPPPMSGGWARWWRKVCA